MNDIYTYRSFNPLFAYRSRSTDGTIINNWASDKEVPIDGYYLAQREGDASRRSLFLSEGKEIIGLSTYEIQPQLEIYVATAWPIPNIFPSWEYSDTYRFCRTGEYTGVGNQVTEGPVYIALVNNWKDPLELTGTPRLEITLQSGCVMTIYLPESMEISDGTWVAFWVAEDGSTYWAHTSHEPGDGSSVSNVFNMDGYYAARWSANNLAQGAFDARLAIAGGEGYEAEADSPAVDDGSKDWLSGGTTKTELDENDANIPDNPAPLAFGDPDNLDENGEPVAWNDSNKHLDTGYHYGAVEQTKDSATIYTTLRYPKERIPNFVYSEQIVYPDISKGDDLAIVSGKYDSVNGKDLTFAIYKGKIGIAKYLCYKRFRGEQDEQGVIRTLPGNDFTFATTSGPLNDFNQGSIYVGVLTWTQEFWGNLVQLKRCLTIYRYDNNNWREIGKVERSSFINQYTVLYQPITLTAQGNKNESQGNDLWVFWVEDYREPTEGYAPYTMLIGSYIPNAAGRPDYITLNTQWLGDLHFRGENYYEEPCDPQYIALKGDWDEDLDQTFNGQPRIVFVDDYKDREPDGTPEIWAARVRLWTEDPNDPLYGQPRDLLNANDPIGNNENFYLPSFAVNQYDKARFGILTDAKRAFCRFIPCSGTDIYKSNLTTNGSNDTWDNPLKEFDGGTNPSVSVCPRSFGNERVFFHAGSDIIDNLSGKFEQALDNGLYPQVTAERPKKDNLFLIHRGGLATKVDIYQIAP